MSTQREQIRISGTQLLTICLLFSIAAHLSLVFLSQFLPSMDLRPVREDRLIQVDLVPSRQVVASDQEAASEAPDRADFVSERDLRAEQETSPDISELGPSESAESTPQQESRELLESFSLSSIEMDQLREPLRQQDRELPRQRRFSRDFVERLEKGEELKLNAFGLDYAGYINRMRDRLSSRWNPMNYFQADMRRYDRISTTVALVLDQNGEIQRWEILSPTLFPHYDQHAVDTLLNSSPFPNPPKSLIQDDGLIYLTWSFIFFLTGWGYSVE